MNKKTNIKKQKKNIKNNNIDYLIPMIFSISIIVPIIAASTQYFIIQYADDIMMIFWAKNHYYSIIDIFSTHMGSGWRPIMNLWYAIGYALWGKEPFYYYILNGILFAGSMVFLYLIGKILHSRTAGLVAILLYLFLDASFILVSKINFIATIGEIFFITSALYYSIQFFKNRDKFSMWMAIGLSGLAFLSKEPSIIIIPIVNLTYLWYNGLLKKNYIIINLIPFVFLFIIYFYVSPNIGSGEGVDLVQRIKNNFQFYYDAEISYQFKTSILLFISLVVAGYYYLRGKLRSQIMICNMWFIVAILPFLITDNPVQPTYLAEANLGMVLLIGIIISEGIRKLNVISLLLIIGIIAQVSVIPGQISNMQNYNHMITENQKTFFETVEAMKQLPINETVFYITEDVRQKYGMQINEHTFQDYLCLQDRCDLKVTSYSDAKYIILPSSLDVYIFQKEMSNEKVTLVKQIKYGENYGIIFKK